MKGIINLLILLRTLAATVLEFVGALIIIFSIVDHYKHINGGGGIGFYAFVILVFLLPISLSTGFIRYSVYIKKRNSTIPETVIPYSLKCMILDILKTFILTLLTVTAGFALLLNSTQVAYYKINPVVFTVVMALIYTVVRKYKILIEIVKLRKMKP